LQKSAEEKEEKKRAAEESLRMKDELYAWLKSVLSGE
jgi:hypothetical protein